MNWGQVHPCPRYFIDFGQAGMKLHMTNCFLNSAVQVDFGCFDYSSTVGGVMESRQSETMSPRISGLEEPEGPCG